MPEQPAGETAGTDVVLPQFDFAMRQMADALTAMRENRPGWQALIPLAQVEYDGVDTSTLTPEQFRQLDQLAKLLERANEEKRNPELVQQRRMAGGREI